MFIETFNRIFVTFDIQCHSKSSGHLVTRTVTVKVSPYCQGNPRCLNGRYPNQNYINVWQTIIVYNSLMTMIGRTMDTSVLSKY